MAAILFVLNALLTLVVVAFFLRLVMPLVRADFRTPLGQAVLRFTDPLVKPLRKLLPPAGKLDVASIVALVLVQLGGTALVRFVAGAGFAPGPVVAAGLLALAGTVLQFYSIAVLVQALLSWVSPGAYSPATQLLDRLCAPLLAPVRKVVPPLGGLDFSPVIVLIGLQALQILLH
ncbi:MAG: YggT family protein [Gammaproteobacteria bacterium]|nr:YggT family protein [Gammaproteobacteria bacterium]